MTAQNQKDTDVHQLLDDLDGGVFVQKLARAFSEAAGGVIDNDQKAKIKVEFDLSRIGNSYQINLGHKLTYSVPTLRGKITEENLTLTPVHVNTGGRISLFPENQGQMFTRTGEPAPSHETKEQK